MASITGQKRKREDLELELRHAQARLHITEASLDQKEKEIVQLREDLRLARQSVTRTKLDLDHQIKVTTAAREQRDVAQTTIEDMASQLHEGMKTWKKDQDLALEEAMSLLPGYVKYISDTASKIDQRAEIQAMQDKIDNLNTWKVSLGKSVYSFNHITVPVLVLHFMQLQNQVAAAQEKLHALDGAHYSKTMAEIADYIADVSNTVLETFVGDACQNLLKDLQDSRDVDLVLVTLHAFNYVNGHADADLNIETFINQRKFKRQMLLDVRVMYATALLQQMGMKPLDEIAFDYHQRHVRYLQWQSLHCSTLLE